MHDGRRARPSARRRSARHRGALVGRWQPETDYATDPHVVLAEEGTWTGTDGCNVADGTWRVGAEGRLVVTSGGHTEIGCEGEPVPYLLALSSRRARR